MTNQHPDAGARPIAIAAAVEEDRLQATAERYKTEFAWVDAEAIEVTMALLRMNRIIGAATRRLIESLELTESLTDARFTLLVTLYFTKERRLAQNEISRELGVSRTNITNLIDGLERDGLVRRVANPADRRVSHAQLTPEGERLCAYILPVMTRYMEETCDIFDDQEKAQLKSYLRRYRRNIRERYLTGVPSDPDIETPE